MIRPLLSEVCSFAGGASCCLLRAVIVTFVECCAIARLTADCLTALVMGARKCSGRKGAVSVLSKPRCCCKVYGTVRR